VEVETVREDIPTVNYLPDCECFVCGAEIQSHKTYCAACINADRRRCFSCLQEYRDAFDNIWCETCHTRPPRSLTLIERTCEEIEGDSSPSARTWLRTAARAEAEWLRGPVRQVELRLLAYAHRSMSSRIQGLRGEDRRVVLDCLERIVHAEAVSACAGENEIDRLAAMDAGS